jgi:glucosamine kinase
LPTAGTAPPDRLVAGIHAASNPAREVARFAVDVAAAARAGDRDAVAIWEEAVDALVETAVAAAGSVQTHGPVRVSWAGGLFAATDLLAEPFRAALGDRLPDAAITPPAGDALDGARLLTEIRPPYEHLLVRRPVGPAR